MQCGMIAVFKERLFILMLKAIANVSKDLNFEVGNTKSFFSFLQLTHHFPWYKPGLSVARLPSILRASNPKIKTEIVVKRSYRSSAAVKTKQGYHCLGAAMAKKQNKKTIKQDTKLRIAKYYCRLSKPLAQNNFYCQNYCLIINFLLKQQLRIRHD